MVVLVFLGQNMAKKVSEMGVLAIFLVIWVDFWYFRADHQSYTKLWNYEKFIENDANLVQNV